MSHQALPRSNKASANAIRLDALVGNIHTARVNTSIAEERSGPASVGVSLAANP